jgi:iron complex outermembrane recepter protein
MTSRHRRPPRYSASTRPALTWVARAAACVALGVPAAAPAQQAAPRPPAPADSEVTSVVVSGIRASLQRAADVKKDATQVMDVITAEDVGKLPDANVAEALQRVTGVQVTRVFGEGQTVSVRGLPLVRVEVDGRTLLGFSARLSPPENEQLGRNSGLDTVPSGLFGRLEVRKSAAANQVEGGLSGSINLVTPNPLDFRKPTLSVRAEGTYSEVSGKFEPGFSGLLARQSDDGKLGVLLAVDYTKRTSTTQAFERNNFFTRTTIGAGTAPGTGADLNGDGVADLSGDRTQYEHFVVDRSRIGVTGEMQYRLSDTFTLLFEGIASKMETSREQDFISWRYTGRAITNPVFQGNTIVAGNSTGALQQAGLHRAEPTTSLMGAISTRWTPGRFVVKTDLSSSRGTLDQVIRQITLDSLNTAVPGRFDYRAGPVPSLDLGTYDVTNAANYRFTQVRANRLVAHMDETVGKGDLEYTFNDGVLSRLSAGVRLRRLDAVSEAFRSQVTPARTEIPPYLTTTNAGNFLPDVGVQFPRTFLTTVADQQYILQRATGGGPLDRNAQRDYDLRERAQALYLMADFDGDLFGLPFVANAGVRAVRTNFWVQTLSQGVTPVVDTNRYTNVLPSANVVFTVQKDFLVRLAASRTMQQAGIAELAPSLFVNVTNRNATGGNATLKPTLATNLDLSFELYGTRNTLISGALFAKDVKDAFADTTTLQTFAGFESLGNIPYTRPANVGSAKVRGLEVGVQRFFDFLPAPFDGMGVIANYTLSDGEGDNGAPLTGLSKNSANLILLYEKGGVSGRVAYNYRDKAAFSFTQGRPDYVAKRSQLDLQLGYEFNKTYAVQFQAQNLDPKASATIEHSEPGLLALNSYALSERRYSVGIRAKF